jgi:hypothetical protein
MISAQSQQVYSIHDKDRPKKSNVPGSKFKVHATPFQISMRPGFFT